MKKNTIVMGLLSALSFASVGHLQAEVSDAQVRNLENRVNVLEQKKGANAMVNPSGRPQVRDGADIFFTADWLIWQAHENGLGYTVKGDADHSTSSALYNSSVKNMHFDWDFGFRVGLGWNTPHDGWDVTTNWTWFRTKAHDSHAVDGDKILRPTFNYSPAEGTVADPIIGYLHTNSQLHLHLNLIDLELGREFFVSKWVTLRPFIGLRNGWVHQKLVTTFTHAKSAGAQTGTASKLVNNFWGIGPKAGLNTQWGLGYGFSLIGNANCSLLYGFFHLENRQDKLFENGDVGVNVNNRDSVRVGRAIGELALGLRWDTMFADDRCHFGIQGGWENLMLFGFNQFKHFIGTTDRNAGSFVANQGDLTFQGWTLSARLDF